MSYLERPSVPESSDNLFTAEGAWWNNACLNFFPDGWAVYAIGYKEAAEILVEYVNTRRQQQDALIYPIVFLYRQYLELAIKDLIRKGRKSLDIHEDLPKSHRIDELWKICMKLLSKISPQDSIQEQSQISRLLNELCQIDPLSISFRYPEDKDGDPTLPTLGQVNIRNIAVVVNKIATILDGADAMIDEYLSFKSDIIF